MTQSSYQKLLRSVAEWCDADDNIRALVLIGSHARGESPDHFADLDLILFATDLSPLISNPVLTNDITKPWISSLKQTSGGDSEWMVILEGGQKIDIVLCQALPQLKLQEWLERFPYRNVLDRGYRIILDKSGSGGIALPEPEPHNLYIDYQTLEGAMNDTLLSIQRAIKFAKRDELWRSQKELAQIRASLLQFLEWQTKILNRGKVDTWYSGRYLQQWADKSILTRMPSLFPHYERREILDALSVAIEILKIVVLDIANILEYPLPSAGQAEFLDWLMNHASEDGTE